MSYCKKCHCDIGPAEAGCLDCVGQRDRLWVEGSAHPPGYVAPIYRDGYSDNVLARSVSSTFSPSTKSGPAITWGMIVLALIVAFILGKVF